MRQAGSNATRLQQIANGTEVEQDAGTGGGQLRPHVRVGLPGREVDGGDSGGEPRKIAGGEGVVDEEDLEIPRFWNLVRARQGLDHRRRLPRVEAKRRLRLWPQDRRKVADDGDGAFSISRGGEDPQRAVGGEGQGNDGTELHPIQSGFPGCPRGRGENAGAPATGCRAPLGSQELQVARREHLSIERDAPERAVPLVVDEHVVRTPEAVARALGPHAQVVIFERPRRELRIEAADLFEQVAATEQAEPDEARG